MHSSHSRQHASPERKVMACKESTELKRSARMQGEHRQQHSRPRSLCRLLHRLLCLHQRDGPCPQQPAVPYLAARWPAAIFPGAEALWPHSISSAGLLQPSPSVCGQWGPPLNSEGCVFYECGCQPRVHFPRLPWRLTMAPKI